MNWHRGRIWPGIDKAALSMIEENIYLSWSSKERRTMYALHWIGGSRTCDVIRSCGRVGRIRCQWVLMRSEQHKFYSRSSNELQYAVNEHDICSWMIKQLPGWASKETATSYSTSTEKRTSDVMTDEWDWGTVGSNKRRAITNRHCAHCNSIIRSARRRAHRPRCSPLPDRKRIERYKQRDNCATDWQ